MSWKPRKCVIALLTLAALACFAALIAVNIKPQHDAYPSSLSFKKGQDFSLGRNVNYFDKQNLMRNTSCCSGHRGVRTANLS